MYGGATASAAPRSSTTIGTVALIKTKHSLTGTHQWYEQRFRGVPVLDGYYAKHTTKAGTVVQDGRKAVPTTLVIQPKTTSAVATSRALSNASARAALRTVPPQGKLGSGEAATQRGTTRLAITVDSRGAALVWVVTARSGEGVVRTLVDAAIGQVRSTKVMSRSAADGHGLVFDPNPVATLKNENLTDQDDADQPALDKAYKTVTLRHLTGNGRKLVGSFAKIIEAKGGLASSLNGNFLYTRSDDRFEQVMSYYHVTGAQEYLQKLGFKDANNEPQKLRVNTFSGDNSFYSPDDDTIEYGEGGVDDAEDAEVIWHEYGHAIQDDIVPGFGDSHDAGSMGEGFGDYWAVTMSVPTGRGFEVPCVMDWDATSYTTTVPHCLRRTDTTKTTDDQTGEVHDDGEIWSGALWDIQKALGRNKSDKVVIESTYFYAPDTTFAAAGKQVVQATRALYGKDAAATVTKILQKRKLIP
ncbi:hypothetical protein VV02_09055 [Luteipulveratus mongoliensis]|uniref:FTP domain-containing protein n=2 Tax=Luteipulveratus mongoliensis TaxID=571913 RepID=A0A0K1JPY2_9MICO|nr:hypothetical protein VV02_09055 [Luteipulveratus mongoliensis]